MQTWLQVHCWSNEMRTFNGQLNVRTIINCVYHLPVARHTTKSADSDAARRLGATSMPAEPRIAEYHRFRSVNKSADHSPQRLASEAFDHKEAISYLKGVVGTPTNVAIICVSG